MSIGFLQGIGLTCALWAMSKEVMESGGGECLLRLVPLFLECSLAEGSTCRSCLDLGL